MKMKLLYVPALMAVMSALVVINSEQITSTTGEPTTWTSWTTTGPPVLNLNGKMFTLSRDRGGISFYHPSYFSPQPTTTTTTKPPITGVSVCLRYIADFDFDFYTIFTLSPDRTPLMLQGSKTSSYRLSNDGWRSSSFSGYNNCPSFQPNIRFWPTIGQDIWNRVCVTVDSMKNVAQMFMGSNMSIRKKLPTHYVWSGQPVIEFPGFDGQVTDIQVWDYPLSYREIFKYMTSSVYGPCSGSALSWSYISYSPIGDPLLEDTYERQAKQPISRRGGGHRPKGEKKREFINGGKRRERKRQQL